uniref:Uncharacterized protein n=1 Tax=Triticum urartu TaxID=4572 RepID=A0A8R7TG43_TRIUA
ARGLLLPARRHPRIVPGHRQGSHSPPPATASDDAHATAPRPPTADASILLGRRDLLPLPLRPSSSPIVAFFPPVPPQIGDSMHVPPPVALPCAHFLPSAAGMRAAHATLHCHHPPPGRPPGSIVRNKAAAHHLVITTASLPPCSR